MNLRRRPVARPQVGRNEVEDQEGRSVWEQAGVASRQEVSSLHWPDL